MLVENRGRLASVSLLALIWAAPAVAQTPPPADQVSGDAGLGDIVVTARRRDEALQSVPIAITALSGAELQQKGIRTIDDLRAITPGLNVSGLRRDDALFYLRGQGPGPQATGSRNFPGVATYFAEVPTVLSGPGTLYDLDSVQILKGPQGTLFGRNTTGGAVLFEPARPTSETGGYARISGGNHKFYEFEGMINAAIKPDQIELRVAGQVSRRQGFTQSIVTGQHLDGRDYEAIRGSLLLKPSESIENLTIVDYRSEDSSGSSEVVTALDPGAVLAPPAGGLVPIRSGGTVNIVCAQVTVPGCPPGGPLGAFFAAYNNGDNADPAKGGFYLIGPTSLFQQYLATQQAIGPRKNQASDIARKKKLNIGFTNKTTINLTDNLTLKNIFGFRKNRTNETLDFDGTPLNFITQTYTTSQAWQNGTNQITEEFQVQGHIPSLKLNYIAGYYYEDSKPGFDQVNPGVVLGSLQLNYATNHDTSNAVFGHVEWNPIDLIGVSGGIRKTWDRRESGLSQTDSVGNCIQVDPANPGLPGAPTFTCPVDYSAKFSALTYDVTLSITPMRNVLIYLSHRKGYRSGGFNLPAPVAPAPNPNAYQTFGPEKIYSYEAGLKADWNVGVPLRTNLSVFYDDYKDVQTGIGALTSTGQPVTIILNAGKVRNQGVEFETTIVPFHALRLSGFVSYLDTHSLVTLDGPNGAPVVIKGQQRPQSPKWKYGINGTLTLPVPESVGDLQLSADYSWQSKVYNTNLVTTMPTFAGYALLNARMDLNDAFGKGIDLSVWATNLTNKTYILAGYPIANLGFEAATYGEPRMYGVSAKIRFGAH